MKIFHRTLLTGLMVVVVYTAGGLANANSRRQRGGDASTELASKEKAPSPNLPPLNACGCYAVGDACVCTARVFKCDCPGDCEPVGCEAKRQKAIDKELAQETRRIQEESRKRDAAEKAKQAALESKDDIEDEDGATVQDGDAPTTGKPSKVAAKRGEKSEDKPASKGGKPKTGHTRTPG